MIRREKSEITALNMDPILKMAPRRKFKIAVLTRTRMFRDIFCRKLSKFGAILPLSALCDLIQSRARPDLILINGQELKAGLHRSIAEFPEAKIVIMNIDTGDFNPADYSSLHPTGYLSIDASESDVVKAVRRILNGESAIPQDIAEKLHEEIRRKSQDKSAHVTDLTAAERRVSEQICKGRSNQQIADALHIAESTVKAHVHTILHKLGCGSRHEVIAKFCEPTQVTFTSKSPSS